MSLSRRTFLFNGALGIAGAAVAGSGILSACGSDSTSSASPGTGGSSGADYGTLDIQLSWIKNNAFAGLYIADQKGYFAEAGFSSVNLMPGGPTVSTDPVIMSGRALMGTTNTDVAATAIANGGNTVIIGSHFLESPFCLVSLASDPITSPEDVAGKTIGLQSFNEPVWEAFCTAAGIDPASVTKVPIQFDPQVLVNGGVDAILGFTTDQPPTLETQGVAVAVMPFADYGYNLVQESVVVRKESLESDRDALKAALIADIRGWRDSVSDPALGPTYTRDVYAPDLGASFDQLMLTSEAQNELVYPPSAATGGIILVTEELRASAIEALNLGGVEITAEQLFDMSLMEEIYDEMPDLKAPIG